MNIDMDRVLLNENGLDKEWVELIIEARNSGISADEIRDFLKGSKGRDKDECSS